MWSRDKIIFPEFDGLMMDNMGTFKRYDLLGISVIDYIGWEGMEESSTECYMKGELNEN